MSALTLTLDGQLISTSATTLLATAAENGITLPTLCHLDGLSDVAACRLCLVEVDGGRLQAACVTRPTEGMSIRTHTPELAEYRRMIIELLFAERNHICSVCVASGNCELQDLAATLGMDHVRFEYLSPDLTVDVSHDRFGVDHHRCILCTRCVRVCDEVEGAHTWDVAGRGTNARVITDLADPWGDATSCTSCGKCVQACPTGALFRKGSSVAEMEHDRRQLTRLMLAREKHEWTE